MRYDPAAPLHDRYRGRRSTSSTGDEAALLRDMTLTINTFFGWDFNSCEALRKDGVFYPIDFANACPDSQVTSLHFHFPWLVKAQLRWSLFCAGDQAADAARRSTGSRSTRSPTAKPARTASKLAAYAAIADERFDTERFEEFCAEHLGAPRRGRLGVLRHRRAPRRRCARRSTALFPEHEIEQFTEHFWGLIQFWRKTEADRIGKGLAEEGTT